jgi:hypothetical protein
MTTVGLRLILQQHLVRLVSNLRSRLGILRIVVMIHYHLLIRLTFSYNELMILLLFNTGLIKRDFLELFTLLVMHVVVQGLVSVMFHLLLKD